MMLFGDMQDVFERGRFVRHAVSWRPIATLEPGWDVLFYVPEEDHQLVVGYLCSIQRLFKTSHDEKAMRFAPVRWTALPEIPD